MKLLRIALIGLHALTGIGAVAAGQALMSDPTGAALAFKVAWLSGSPFPDYRFPGLFLAVVIGGTQLASALTLATRRRVAPVLSLASNLLLVTWLVIQWAIIGYQGTTQLIWVVLFPTMAVLAAINARDDALLKTLLATANRALGRVRVALPISIGVVGLLLATYLTVLHPWLMNWGSTAEEQRTTLPGDTPGLPTDAYFTRAISIAAAPADVWPWLLQIGQDRAGFYSNTWLENLFGGDIHNGSALEPGWQERQLGDRIPMAGAEGTSALGDVTKLTVRVYEPERVIGDIPGRFVLIPEADGTTRLLLREPLDIPERRGIVGPLLWDPMHFVMEQRMLRGIKERAETQPLTPTPLLSAARVGWVLAGLGLLAYFVSRPRWLPWLVVPALVAIPTIRMTGDYDAALAGALAVGITTLGALAFGRRWWAPYLLVASAVLLTLLLAPDAYVAFGLMFLVGAGVGLGYAGVVQLHSTRPGGASISSVPTEGRPA